MRNQASSSHHIKVSQLRIGLYVHLDLGWMDHPFSTSNFKIADQNQIDTIKSLGLEQLRYDPSRSSVEPLQFNNVVEFPVKKVVAKPKLETTDEHTLSDLERKQQRLQQTLHESEKKFLNASLEVKQIQKLANEHPEQAYGIAQVLVHEMVTSILTESDIAIHAMSGIRTGDEHYQHELNTLVLSMMLAKNCQLSAEETIDLGMAALLHDIGKRQITPKIMLKKEPLTHIEKTVYQSHVGLGLNVLKALHVPKRILTIVSQHHEFCDGSGYPAKLKGEEIDSLAHLLIIVNMFDHICNPVNPQAAKTPYEALGLMFAQQRQLFDQPLLRQFIKSLGIYPPGSIVRLSDQRLASVLSTNPQQPLRPFVQIVDESDELNEHIIDLREAMNINITQCIKQEQLPTLLRRLSFRRQRTNYFLDQAFQ